MKRQASKEYSINKKFPQQTLNITTAKTLGNSDAPIEVFPPEIFFKGKYTFDLCLISVWILFELNTLMKNYRYRDTSELWSYSNGEKHQQKGEKDQVLTA